METETDKKEINISIGWLIRKSWAKMDKGVLSITEIGQSSKDKLGDDESLLETLIEKATVSKDQINEDMANGLSALLDRKNLISEHKTTYHSFKLTDLGREILATGFTIEEEATQLTHEQLKEGSWKDLKYRPYDINAEYPLFFPGKEHPLRRIIQEGRLFGICFLEFRFPFPTSRPCCKGNARYFLCKEPIDL